MLNLRVILTFAILLMMVQVTMGDAKLSAIFSDNMVIQQEKPFKIWGTSQPGEAISVTLADKTQSVTAADNGTWSMVFPPMKASFTPMEITVNATNSIVIKNVLVGEVWLCSGQSNMQWPVSRSNYGKEEIAAANNKNIRIFVVSFALAVSPQNDCGGSWQICSPSTIGEFSAVGYFFAKQLQNELNVPVGMIGSYWGGTCIETWTPKEYLAKVDAMKPALAEAEEQYGNLDDILHRFQQKTEQVAAENDQLEQKAIQEEALQKYQSVDFDDSTWKTMRLPCKWETAGLPEYDGVVWFRKKVQIPQELAGKDLVLTLGAIDDFDVTYFNGEEVGKSGSRKPPRQSAYNIERKYVMPGKLVKPGENIIAIRVCDDFNDGGFAGPINAMNITIPGANTAIPLAGDWKYSPTCAFKLPPKDPQDANLPYRLYMGMIHPIAGYPIRGTIWYQGESNAGNGILYRELMPAMISAWRDRWNDQSIVFIQTQLANFWDKLPDPTESTRAELREAQSLTAQKDPLTGMAVTIDIGDTYDIHPGNKQDVGKRLSLIARNIAYKQNVNAFSPVYKSMEIKGNKAYILFDNLYGGLHAKGDKLIGFSIAGADKKFLWADAEIQGDQVIVWSDKVQNPVAVRYAWADNPNCNLYNSADLPATPFRTDDGINNNVSPH